MLELKNISINFGKNNIVENLNIVFQPSEIIGLVAPNGMGKSTILKVMMNYLKPNQGEILINGKNRYHNLKPDSKVYQLISMMPDQNDLYNHMTGYDHLNLYQTVWKTNHLNISDISTHLQMDNFLNKKVREYSLGMRQRLCFAMQIISDTQIMLMDEVMNGLDPNNVELVSRVILEKKAEGKTVIISSHLLQNLERYADRVFFLFDGSLETFLDKKKGYTDNSLYIKVNINNMLELTDLFPDFYIFQLNHECIIIKLKSPKQLSTVTEILIKHSYLSLSVGYLNLEDAYQLKF